MIDYGLTDKVAIVTGGSDGLGRATAKLLAAEGVKVVICGRREDYLKDAAKNAFAGKRRHGCCRSGGCIGRHRLREPDERHN